MSPWAVFGHVRGRSMYLVPVGYVSEPNPRHSLLCGSSRLQRVGDRRYQRGGGSRTLCCLKFVGMGSHFGSGVYRVTGWGVLGGLLLLPVSLSVSMRLNDHGCLYVPHVVAKHPSDGTQKIHVDTSTICSLFNANASNLDTVCDSPSVAGADVGQPQHLSAMARLREPGVQRVRASTL